MFRGMLSSVIRGQARNRIGERMTTPVRRNLFSTSRPPLSLRSRFQRNQYGAPRVQGVRFHYRSLRVKDLLVPIMFFLAGREIYQRTVVRSLNDLDTVLDEIDKEHRNAPGEGHEDGDEDYEDINFLPFPGTIRRVQPGPWRRSDPEYIEYGKLANDKDLINRIIADAAPWAAQKIPEHGYAFRTLKLKPHALWVDAKFQQLPPPYYTQSGIEIGAGFIDWTQLAIESDMAQRIQRTLYPLPAAKAMWNFARVAFTYGDANEKAGQILTEHMALPTGTKITFEQLAAATPAGRKAAEERQKAARKKAADLALRLSEQQEKTIESGVTGSNEGSFSEAPSTSSSRQTMNRSESPETQKSITIIEWARKMKEGGWSEEDGQAVKAYFQSLPGMQYLAQVSKRFQYATAVSAVTFQKEYKPMVCPPPRGAIQVSGLMQMLVPNGWMMFDVDMHWDPKTREFDEQSFRATLVKSSIDRRKLVPAN